MSKSAPFLLFIGGLILAWLAITGRLAVFLAAIFAPDRVVQNG